MRADVIAPRTAWRAAGWYLVITLVMTWPLARGLARDLPWDLGDSLLNCWILAWNSERLLRLLGGDLTALHGFFDGNFFHPQKLTLAYSELLLTQTITGLPAYAATGNVILTYNVVFLSTFVLSGIGTFLLVRQITGDWRPAFASGLVFAFLPWRFGQMPHVQVLTTQWMPFTLYFLRRYFDTGRAGALIGTVAALVANNLSNGYFLLFFAPFVAAYVLWEMASRRLLGDLRAWAAMAGTGIVSVALTVPFMLPYLELRRLTGEHRSLDEVAWFSADVYAYLTAEYNLTLLGKWLRTFPRAEGDLFPGFTTLALSLLAVVWAAQRTWRATRAGEPAGPARGQARGRLLGIAVAVSLAAAAVYLAGVLILVSGFGGRFVLGPLSFRVNSVTNALRMLGLSVAVVLACSRRARAMLGLAWRSPVFSFLLATVAAWWLSLGPRPHAFGREMNAPGLYSVLYTYVPGYDGLRVPARFAVMVMLGLSVLSGFGIRDLLRGRQGNVRAGWALAALGVFFLAESTAAPIPLNVSSSARAISPPARVYARDQAPPVYRYVAGLPPGSALLELPFGDSAWDVRAVFYSTVHWRPLLNGYSGGFPESYLRLRGYLDNPLRAPNDAFDALMASGATHVLLHASAYASDEAGELRQWLASRGITSVAQFGTDEVYRLRERGAGSGEQK